MSVRLIAMVAVALAALAVFLVESLVLPRSGVPLIPRPAEGWLWERSWGRQTLWWGMLVLAIVTAVVAVAVVPPDTTAATFLRAALLAVAAWGAVRQKRRDRPRGIGAPRPFGHHGPPGWEWDGDRATWRRP